MIIVKLMGGLGNQMFQYAAGRRLALFLGVDIKLDISWFKKNPLRSYDLGAFNIVEHFASTAEVLSLTNEKRHMVARLAKRVLPAFLLTRSTHVKERYSHFDNSILSLPDNVYLNGYWQSEKYFLNIEDIIRKEFTVKFQQTGKNLELDRKIASCESVSIHVRRGDYITNEHINRTHGVCGIEYYLLCVDKIKQYIENPVFFVFSDEPEWARDNLELPYETTLVHHNGADRNYEDLRLMSQCKHHVIANSSFSWWGAWLNQHSEKVVLAPRQWFGKERQASRNMNDLLPDSWVKL
jgi:hypothetical protein